MTEPAPICDQPGDLPVSHSRTVHQGAVFDLVSEQVDLGSAGVVQREFLSHPGAVAILALDERERVAMVHQYRHPVRSYLWEIPAGLLDVPGETRLAAAQRELAEEADLRAEDWHTLLDFYTTPGGSNEPIRIFLARGLHQVPRDQRHQREAEELEMTVRWVDLDEAVAAVLAGRIHNSSAAAGLLAAAAARTTQWQALRPAGADWHLA
ncbi:MAG TPA: NUDIX hydrolase [Ruania sp.]|nr:NUDIX hydrolase [Ruania sp.]